MNVRNFAAALLALAPALALAEAPAGAAEIVLVTGSAKATSASGTRSLSAGDSLQVGEMVSVGNNSYVNLKFPDDGRILLRPNTEFMVEAYRYNAGAAPAAPAPDAKPAGKKAAPAAAPAARGNQALFRLVRGGFRAITGLIKGDRNAYAVTTPVATIGIRGTDYEVAICSDDCPQNPGAKKQAAAEPILVAASDLSGLQLAQAGGGSAANGGLLVATNEGTVVLKTGKGEYLVKVGEIAFAIEGGAVTMLNSVPDALLNYTNTDPEACD